MIFHAYPQDIYVLWKHSVFSIRYIPLCKVYADFLSVFLVVSECVFLFVVSFPCRRRDEATDDCPHHRLSNDNLCQAGELTTELQKCPSAHALFSISPLSLLTVSHFSSCCIHKVKCDSCSKHCCKRWKLLFSPIQYVMSALPRHKWTIYWTIINYLFIHVLLKWQKVSVTSERCWL